MAETAEERRARLRALQEKAARFYREPWTLYQEPFHVVGSIYYVGNTYVSTYLIDTGEGLVLIDPGFKETIYLVFDSIRKLGFDPKDIRHIFLSHGHVDHCGGTRFLQEYSHAKVWLGEGDAFFFTECPDLTAGIDHIAPFTIDEFYDYSKTFSMGSVSFRFVHSPGHTPGCTSIFVTTEHRGRKVVAAMHGGLGLNGLSYEELEENRLPRSLQADFVNGLRSIQNEAVDVVIVSHNHNYDILGRHRQDDGSGDAFIDPDGWKNMIQNVLEKARDVLPDQFPDTEKT